MRTYRPKNKALPASYSLGFIDKMDGRQELTKRLSNAFQRVVEDAGGFDVLPYAKVALCERFAFLEEFLRQIEVELIKGAVDRADLLGKWGQAVNAMNGLCRTLVVSDRSKKDWIDANLYDVEVRPVDSTPPASDRPGRPKPRPRSRERV